MIERASVLSAARSSSEFLIYLICLLWIGIHPLNKISSSTAWCNVYMTLSVKLMIGLYQVWMIFSPQRQNPHLASESGSNLAIMHQRELWATKIVPLNSGCTSSTSRLIHNTYMCLSSAQITSLEPRLQCLWTSRNGVLSLGLRDGIPSANPSKGAALTVASKSQRMILWASWETILVQNL